MKTLLTYFLTLLALQLQAQDFSDPVYKDFSIPTSEEVYLKSCSFDPEAPAVYLRKDATVVPDQYKMITYVRNRIKILKSTGVDQGNIKIRYYHSGGYEKIGNLKAVTINYDDQGSRKIAAITGKDIHYTKEDQYYTVITFSMPEVKEGSIIEYSYFSERRTYRVIDYWYFQDELPVIQARFDYTILPGAEFSYRVLKPKSLPISLEENKTEGRLVFAMKNMPGITDEPFMDSKRDYLSRVELQMNSIGANIDRQRFVATWPELSQELLKDESFGLLIKRKIPGTEEILRQAALMTSPKNRMNFIFRQIQQQLTWDHYIGIYASEKPKTTWDKKQGSTAEINLILLSLLNAADIPAFPLLVSTRSHGKISESHPFISQFSAVIAYVEIDGKQYFLDASGNHVNIDLIPESLLNTTGYLVDRKQGRFISINDPHHFEKRFVNIVGKINAAGIMKGQAFVTDHDYARVHSAEEIKRGKEKFIRDRFSSNAQVTQVDSFQIRNLDYDTLALEMLVDFRQQLEQTGGYALLIPNMFGGIEKNPFLADKRYTEINFGSKKLISFNQSYELEDQLAIEALPKTMAWRTADTGLLISRLTEASADGRKFIVKIRLEINRTLYAAAEYEEVKEFFKKMYGILNDPIVLKHK